MTKQEQIEEQKHRKKYLKLLAKLETKEKGKRNVSLSNFVTKECTNFVSRQCVFDQPCKILKKKPCDYFRKAVLGPVDYRFKLPTYNYFRLHTQYDKIVNPGIRICGDCNIVELLPRQRCCEKCRKIRVKKRDRKQYQKNEKPA